MIEQSEDGATRTLSDGPELAWLALRYAAIGRRRFIDEKGRIRDYVSREPSKALGLALGAGVIVGWLIKRR